MKFKKVVLAYSGGLDTSVIAKWLMEKYECEVITFTADIGQGSETKDAKIKALIFASFVSEPCPISAVNVMTSHSYFSINHFAITEVSNPPEYARTTFLNFISGIFLLNRRFYPSETIVC